MKSVFNPKNGQEMPRLGFGFMRLPKKGAKIDIEASTRLVLTAVEKGITYFDTAYIYNGSEEALGEIIQKEGLRRQVHLATKLPPYFVRSNADIGKIFEKQLSRLRTDYIDYYLIHMLSDTESWDRLKKFGIIEWIAKQKESGAIKNIGFSFHGGKKAFCDLLDAYEWDFCMVQYNYADKHNQAGIEGVKYAAYKGLPVFVMEPLRGGSLVAGLPKKAAQIFKQANPERSAAEWGFKWLINQPEITMVLSGMSDEKQLIENAAIFSDNAEGCMTDDENETCEKVRFELNSSVKIPCTGCGYCLPCPQGVDIPTCFSCYNESFAESARGAKHRYFMTTGSISVKQSYASKCVKCRRCEKHCPQSIIISERMGEVSTRMESSIKRAVFTVARSILKLKRPADKK